MTSTTQPSCAGDPVPSAERVIVVGDVRDETGADPETTYLPLVPPAGPESTDVLSDPTARELRALRREIAQLRADYARLRALLPGPGPGGPAGPGGWMSAPGSVPLGRPPHDGEVPRPGFRPGPVPAPRRGPRAAQPGRGPVPRPPAPPSPAPRTPAPRTPAAQSPAAHSPAAHSPAAHSPAAPTPAAPTPASPSPAAETPAPRPPAPRPPSTGAGPVASGTSESSTRPRAGRPTPFRRTTPPAPGAARRNHRGPAADRTAPALTTALVAPTTPIGATDGTTAAPTTDATTAPPAAAPPATDAPGRTSAPPADVAASAPPTADSTATSSGAGTAGEPPTTDATTALAVASTPDDTTLITAVPTPRVPGQQTGRLPAARPLEPITSLLPGTFADSPPTIRIRVRDSNPFRPARPAGRPVAPPAPAAAVPSSSTVAAGLAAVLAEVLTVEEVAADAHFFDDLGADSMLMAQFCARVRKRPELPAVSIKDIYRHPSIAALATALAPVVPAPSSSTGVAAGLAAVLAEVLTVEEIAADAHFFDDLGADSMLMAQFCARVRKRPELPAVSIKDIYRHPSIAALAGTVGGPVEDECPPTVALRPTPPPAEAPQPPPDPETAPLSRSRPRFHLCGLLQLVYLLGFPLVLTSVAATGFAWVAAAVQPQELYLRALAYSAASFAGACLLPILAKWTLVGRWKPRRMRVWSLVYLRFWLVKSLVQANPLARFAGSPIFSVYLRLLGARIGRGVVIFSPTVPVATDLFTAGAGTIIRKDSMITGYRAVDGVIQIGPVTLGRDVYIGEKTVLDIGTSMGDGAQLGHSSALHTGQAVPAGERWHGSPAEPTTLDHRTVRSIRLSALRRVVLPLLQVSFLVAVTLPLALCLPIVVFRQLPLLTTLVGSLPPAIASWAFYRDALLVATVLFGGSLLLGLLVMVTVPRLLRVLVRPDREYRLYGVRFWAHRRIARMTNSRFFVQLLGDSAYIVDFVRSIGYDLSAVVQTGSNFGSDVKHDSPFLSTVGTGTVIADGMSFINADYSASHFRLSRVTVGAHNFLGNRVAYPAQGRTGDNCLLATKVMVPMDGPVREGVGLLGSPSFEIPRTVDRDHRLDVTDPAELRRKLRTKTWHNTVTILIFLLSRWVLTAATTVLSLAAVDLHSEYGLAVALSGVLLLPLSTGYLILVDLLARRMMVHRPNGCSIYDRAFRRHERFWKLGADRFPQLYNGTPFKGVVWRLLGARVGRRVFDDGCTFTERRFVTIGDRCTLNAGSIVQCHSQEDGAFKSDRSSIGDGTTLGVGAFVHYGVRVGAGARIEADSFLMKGSVVAAGSRWGGNPALELDDPRFDDTRRAVLAGSR